MTTKVGLLDWKFVVKIYFDYKLSRQETITMQSFVSKKL